jgi:hypothetical protein
LYHAAVDTDADADLEDEPAEEQDDLTEDDDGEADEADGLEITESDREKDRNLAIQFAAATLTGAATLVGVVPGALITMFAPIAAAIMTAAVQRLGRRRAEHAADTLLDAADAAGVPLAEFMDKAVSDDRRHELFARSMRIAQDTARRDKRRGLGRALAAGIMGDEARIDEELLFIRAVDDIDEMHIRLLDRMATVPPPNYPWAWSAASIVNADPGLATAVQAIIGTLQTHGLIKPTGNEPAMRNVGGQNVLNVDPGPFYEITDSGRMLLDRLREDPVLPDTVGREARATPQAAAPGNAAARVQ